MHGVRYVVVDLHSNGGPNLHEGWRSGDIWLAGWDVVVATTTTSGHDAVRGCVT